MAESKFEKNVKRNLEDLQSPVRSPHPELKWAGIRINLDETFVNKGMTMDWAAVSYAFTMVKSHHKHDFDQCMVFWGGDPTNMLDLGGEVEMTLSEDGKHRETLTFTKPFSLFIPKGTYHCPLNFKVVKDPKKPIMFGDFVFSTAYKRV
jgi:hypothetical protein